MSDCHVLMIESRPQRCEAVTAALAPLGLSLHVCASAAQARCWIDRHGVPDLMLIEPDLVDETGLAFIAVLRAGADWQQTLPVIVMRAPELWGASQQLADAGVWQVVHDAAPAAGLRDAVRAALNERPSVLASIVARTRFAGDESMYASFRAAALRQLPTDVQCADQALSTADWATLQRAAHDIKGVLAMLREDGPSEVARRLEQSCDSASTRRAGVIWAVLRKWLAWYAPADGARPADGRAPSLYLPAP